MDRTLVIAAQHGDEDAFAALVLGVGDRLYATAYRILRDRSLTEDVVQHTMLTAWRKLPRLRDPDRFVAWVFQIMVRAAYQAARREQHRADIHVLSHDASGAPDAIRQIADRDELERAFARLTAEHRAVIVLRHYLDWQLSEIASTLDVPVGTARSRLHYALRALRAAIEAEGRSSTRAARR